MNRQRGVIATIWLYLAGAIAVIVALTGLVVAWNKYTASLDQKGYDRGIAETTAAFQKRDNAQLQAAIAAQHGAEVRAAQAEQAALKSQSDASQAYSKGVNDGKAKTAALIAAARAGSLQLRDPGNQAGASPACDSPTGQAAVAGSAARSNDGAGVILSAEAGEFLLGLTGEADDTARQLTACQVILISDRKLCNGP